MTLTLRGHIHSDQIELERDPGLDEGQAVEIQLTVIAAPQPWGDGLRRSAGALAGEWSEEDGRILEELHRQREQDSCLQP